MSAGWSICCDRAELVVDCARAAAELGVAVEPSLSEEPVAEAIRALGRGQRSGIAVTAAPSPEDLVRLARTAGSTPVLAALVGRAAQEPAVLALAADLGLVAVRDVEPLASAAALIDAGATRPWTASLRALPEVDRARLAEGASEERGGGRLTRENDGRLGWSSGKERAAPVGRATHVCAAITAMRAALAPRGAPPSVPERPSVDRARVLEVIFGPPRALSDPASKAALSPYGVPLPLEELCTSPSRAAAEASRMGFPVRIALASPDLRVWDHPDLAVDGVDSAARAREVFRQTTTLARARAPAARILGVTVTAAATARAVLSLVMRPLSEGLVLCDLGFADAHGIAAGDHTRTVLPAGPDQIERVVSRLGGASLLLDGTPATRRETVEALTDVLDRLAAFVDAFRGEVARLEVDPLAVIVGGGVEVREACVTVGDAFVRRLAEPARAP